LHYSKHNRNLKFDDGIIENVTENRLDFILNLMQNNPRISTEKIADKLQLSKRTILRDIEKLKSSNRLKYVGSAKNGYWNIIL